MVRTFREISPPRGSAPSSNANDATPTIAANANIGRSANIASLICVRDRSAAPVARTPTGPISIRGPRLSPYLPLPSRRRPPPRASENAADRGPLYKRANSRALFVEIESATIAIQRSLVRYCPKLTNLLTTIGTLVVEPPRHSRVRTVRRAVQQVSADTRARWSLAVLLFLSPSSHRRVRLISPCGRS